jgi:ABC-2 type transport system permease protein
MKRGKQKMFNIHIFNKTARSNVALWIILMILPAVFVNIIVIVMKMNIADGQSVAQVSKILDMGVFTSMGFEIVLIYIIIVANKLVASEVQSGAITYVATSSVPRRGIISTKIYFFVGSLFVGFFVVLVLTAPVIGAMQDSLDISLGGYVLKLFGMFLLLFATSSISFMASSFFNKSVWSFLVGAGVPIFFFLMNTLSSINSAMEPIKYLSLNTLFTDAAMLADGKSLGMGAMGPIKLQVANSNVGGWIGQYLALTIFGVGMYIGSSYIFVKKDLPL